MAEKNLPKVFRQHKFPLKCYNPNMKEEKNNNYSMTKACTYIFLLLILIHTEGGETYFICGMSNGEHRS